MLICICRAAADLVWFIWNISNFPVTWFLLISIFLKASFLLCSPDILDDRFVLVADTHIPGIFQISMEGEMERFTALPLDGIIRPIALAFDPIDSRVYWTDVRLGSFSRAFLNGTGQEVLGRAGVDGKMFDFEGNSVTLVFLWQY